MPYRRVAAAAFFTLTVFARVASAQTPATPTGGVGAFFRTLYAPATRDVQSNGGPTLTAGSYGGALVLNSLLVAEIANLPTASNAGGFTYTYDSALGTWSRSADSFGSQVGERSNTVGRGKVSFGFAYQRFTFDKLNGQPMSTAAIESIGQIPGSAPLRLQERVSLSKADISLRTVFLNFGVTSWIDVGVFMPFVSVALDGSLAYTLRRGGANGPLLSQGTNTVVARAEGLGDPVIRAKVNLVQRSAGGLAFATDARLHSGNELGAAGLKFQVIASGSSAIVNTHVNIGFATLGCNKTPDNACGPFGGFFVLGGIDKAVLKRLTLATDVQMQRTEIRQRLNQTIPTSTEQNGGMKPLVARADTVTVAMTGKINVWGNLLVTVTGMVPAKSGGLSDRFTPIIGLDYAW